jgi:hypothetical protein
MRRKNETKFPYKKYLKKLVRNLEAKNAKRQSDIEKLMMHSGVVMNWIADYITDDNIVWKKEKLLIDKLYLTGTNPTRNKIIIDICERSPKKLREYFQKHPNKMKIFKEAVFQNIPILVRYDEKKYKVFDGMHRTIAAIREGKKYITAYVARIKGKPRPKCEAHVVYDLLKTYQRGINRDSKGLESSLRYLKRSYSNIEWLLKHRFNENWVHDRKINRIINNVLRK